jgi:ABC-2 type transport system ATP-binding protein
MELLERFGLGERANEKVGRYSGGMAQRLMIARALMHQPLVLFLDEPTTGLDPQSRLFLWETMLDLRRRGTTLVLTTHDMAEADRLCDRIAIVDHGSIIALDTPRGLRNVLPATAGIDVVLETASEPPAAPFEAIEGVEKVEVGAAGEGRWRVRVYGESKQLAQGALAVAQNGALPDAALLELRRIEGSLEDVFMHLTGREMR